MRSSNNDQFLYPNRESYFAHRFVRLLQKSSAAQDIGAAACYLLCMIAHVEDELRYTGPARFWRSQLLEVLGFRSPKQLGQARDKAVSHGWLRYRQNGTRKIGEYYVTIPERFACLLGTPTEAPGVDPINSVGGTNSGTDNGTNQRGLVPPEATKRNEIGTISGNRGGTPPIPLPETEPSSRDSRVEEPISISKGSKKQRPDFRPYDLTNENDVFSAHQQAVALGYSVDGYDGLLIFAAHAARAVRKGKDPAKYLAKAICDDVAKYMPADCDTATAKRMLKRLEF